MLNDGTYYLWNRGEQAALGRHFSTREFDCQCHYAECTQQRVAVELVERLDQVRDEYGQPVVINSGYRCARHQADLLRSGEFETVQNSQHCLGRAADIRGKQMTLLVPAVKKHFTAIGLAKTWLHADLRPGYRRWFYK